MLACGGASASWQLAPQQSYNPRSLVSVEPLQADRRTAMLRTRALFMLCVSLLSYAPVLGQDAADINAKIRKEETDNSKIMHTMHFLTDVYGPRLTGSPNLKAAGEWAIKEMTSWGFENGHLEGWDFGHPGWVNEHFTGHIVSPVKDQLACRVLAWTPSTKGTVTT